MASSQTLDGNSIGPYINLTNGVVATYQTFTGLVAAGYTNVSGNLTSTTNTTLQSYSVSAPAALTTLKTYIGQSMSNVNVVALITQITLLADNTASIYGRWRDGAYLPSAPPAPPGPPPPVTPTGGVITTNGLYTLHTFTTSGTFTTPYSLECFTLLISGGGGGGGINGGGGGGAGQFNNTARTLDVDAYPITVGGGGLGKVPGSQDAEAGGTTSAFGTVLVGGCYGQSLADDPLPDVYATGGGGSQNGGAAGVGNPGGLSEIGNAGGAGRNGDTVSLGAGGGGGGADTIGGSAYVEGGFNTTGGGGGGGTTVNAFAATYYEILGGGAGGGVVNGTAAPDFGGGDGGGLAANGLNASPGTGGGGGGGGASGVGAVQTSGGNGGSGLVVVAYLTPV